MQSSIWNCNLKLFQPTSSHAYLLSPPAISNREKEKKKKKDLAEHKLFLYWRKVSALIKGLVTSLSQSQRMVMMARIKVWIAVPPKIIPAQIPYECPISFADVTIE